MTKILFPEGASSSASNSGEVGSTSSKMNYSRFITSFAARRQPSIIRELNRPFPPGRLTLSFILNQSLSSEMVLSTDFQKKLWLWAYLLHTSDFVLFTAGKPNPALFPFSKATFETDDGQKFEFKGAVMKEALQYQNSLVSFLTLSTFARRC